ncbi:MAG: hypothetical protein Q7K29_03665 [Thermoleophilia bacterium]|nr:hypothetical protein [Thermoleophilia bacterium]
MRLLFTFACLCLVVAGCSAQTSETDTTIPGDASSDTAQTGSVSVQTTTTPAPIDLNQLPLFIQAKTAVPERYDFAVAQGAQFVPTSDGRSFYVLWTPKDFASASLRPMIVTLHGHGSWALDEFYLWQPYAEQRGYGIIALQWWFGGGEAVSDYYAPDEISDIFEKELTNQKIEPGKALFHGFSRGSANSYVVTALDREGSRFFGLTISNSGGMVSNYPPNIEIINGRFGAAPFSGAHWVMYCGEKDQNPARDGCSAMQAARETVTGLGATVDLFIDDPAGGHGGFHRNPANVNQALDVFDQLIGR